MFYSTNSIVQALKIRLHGNVISIMYEFQEKLIKVRFNIDTLQLWVHVFIYKNKIWVDLKSTTLAKDKTNLVLLTRL